MLNSEIVSVPVTVVVPNLPGQSVSMLMGNVLAGDRVIHEPVMSEKPCFVESTKELCDDLPDLFLVCAVTRSMTTDQAGHLREFWSVLFLREYVHGFFC